MIVVCVCVRAFGRVIILSLNQLVDSRKDRSESGGERKGEKDGSAAKGS